MVSWDSIENDLYLDWLEIATDLILSILIAIIVFFIGMIIIKIIVWILKKVLAKRKWDQIAVDFFGSVAKLTLMIFLFFICLDLLRLKLDPLTALIAAVGIGAAFAMSGLLNNFFAGMFLILSGPLKQNDLIAVEGVIGFIQSIKPFSTILYTLDHKYCIVPNAKLVTSVVYNTSKLDTRRIQIYLQITHFDDIDEAKAAILSVCKRNKRVIQKDKKDSDKDTKKSLFPQVWINDMTNDGVKIEVRIWCKTGEWEETNFEVHEAIKNELDRRQVRIAHSAINSHLFEEATRSYANPEEDSDSDRDDPQSSSDEEDNGHLQSSARKVKGVISGLGKKKSSSSKKSSRRKSGSHSSKKTSEPKDTVIDLSDSAGS